MWNCRIIIPTRVPALALSIASSTQISTRCMMSLCPGINIIANCYSSGSVCLDVINQTWSPMFDMINIFEVFLPQLLRYPNPTDPLNGEAAALLLRDPKNYEVKVKGMLLCYTESSGQTYDARQSTFLDMPLEMPRMKLVRTRIQKAR